MRPISALCWGLACGSAHLPVVLAQTDPFRSPPSSAASNAGRPEAPREGNLSLPNGQSRPALPPLQIGNVSVGERDIRYNSGSTDERMNVRLGMDSQTGGTLNIDYARVLNENWAWGINTTTGANQLDVVINTLYSLPRPWYLGLSAGYLRRTDTYAFYSGPDKATVSQGSFRLNLQRDFEDKGVITDAGVQFYMARAKAPTVDEKVMTEETATELRFLVDPRRISPGQLTGLGVSLGLQPWSDARLKLGLGSESVRYNFQDGSSLNDRRANISADLQQRLSGCWRVDAGLNIGVSGERLNLAVGRGPWSIGVNLNKGRDSAPSSTQLTVGYNVPLGGRSPSLCVPFQAGQGRGIDRLDEVFRRPMQLPTTVLARVDMTAKPYLLASIDKTALNGGQVSATPDALIVQLPGGAALTVLGVTLGANTPGAVVLPGNAVGVNGEPYASITSDGRLRIAVRSFPNPGAGVSSTVEILVLQPGAQLALVTFNVVGQ
jgi:hypothetical protein